MMHRETAYRMELILYINFVDFEKAFDSVDRESLSELMRHCAIPEKILVIQMVKAGYNNMSASVIFHQRTSKSFKVEAGVKQGWLLSSFLFLLDIDWITKKAKEQTESGIKWVEDKQLGDLDFADDLALFDSQPTTNATENNTSGRDG